MNLSSAHRWMLSAGATAASAYTLDALATAAGAALVVSGLLEGVSRSQLLTLLAGSYLLWAAGLRVALDANWLLLHAAGTSASLPSLLAYDFARRRTGRLRLQRLAASTGYVATELAKEAPYYLAAFGAAALSTELTTDDALIFLTGTTLGAAVSECALGIAVRVGVRRIAGSACAVWLCSSDLA